MIVLQLSYNSWWIFLKVNKSIFCDLFTILIVSYLFILHFWNLLPVLKLGLQVWHKNSI